MRTLGTRRAVLIAGLATVTAAALAACSAGQIAETSLKNSSVYGVNAQNADGSVLIRGLAVTYKDSAGYPSGGDAPLEVNLYNQSTEPITVLVSSQPPAEAAAGQNEVGASSVVLVGGEPASTTAPSPSASASVSAGRPARIEIASLGSAIFRPGDETSLRATGLTGALIPGGTLNLVFEFSNGGEALVVQAPMAIPMSPASRAPGAEAENHEPE